MTYVFLVLLVVVGLFLWGRIPAELVGLLAVVVLAQLGSVTPAEATEGFGNSIVITMGGLFVMGGALVKTGVAQLAGEMLERGSGGRPRRLLVLVVLVSASLSTVLSSTGTVALLIPAVVAAAHATGRSPSKYLIPLAYGSLLGGTLTLVGGPPNLIAQEALVTLGREGLGFFGFAWVGGPILLMAVGYLALFGERLLPDRVKPALPELSPTVDELLQKYGVLEGLYKVTLPPEGRWQPTTLGDLRLRSQYHVDVAALREPGTGTVCMPSAKALLRPSQVFYARATESSLQRLSEELGVVYRPYSTALGSLPAAPRALAELLLLPRSGLNGKSLAVSRFFRRFGVKVIQVRRGEKNLSGDISESRLRFGDVLLVEGPLSKLADLQRERFDFVVIGDPIRPPSPGGLTPGGRTALAICFAMLLSMVFGWQTPAMASVLAAVAILLTGCLTLEEAYGAIQWSSLFLVATMLPLGTALSKSGGVDFLANGLLAVVGDKGALAALAGIYLIATFLGQVMSNTATAMILTPLAVDTARALNLAPEPFLMGVAFGSAMAFLTPVASPVNTLVVVPGGYRFSDFVKVGLPLHLLATLICLWLIPLVFPFTLDTAWSWPK